MLRILLPRPPSRAACPDTRPMASSIVDPLSPREIPSTEATDSPATGLDPLYVLAAGEVLHQLGSEPILEKGPERNNGGMRRDLLDASGQSLMGNHHIGAVGNVVHR